MDNKELQAHQKYVRFIHQYATSLTGVKGLYNKSIVCIAKNDGKKQKKISSISESSKKLQAGNLKRRNDEQFQKGVDLVKSLRTRVQEAETKDKMKLIESQKNKILENNVDQFALAVHWIKLQVLLDEWIEFCNSSLENASKDYKAADLVEELGIIFVECFSMWSCVSELCTELNGVCKLLGLKDLFSTKSLNNELTDKKDHLSSVVSSSKTKKKGTSKKVIEVVEEQIPVLYNKELTPRLKLRMRENAALYKISMHQSEFQLKFLGGFMNRCNASGKIVDPRVPFRPDEWQAQLLDIVDKDESALICAPTSSGKTYVAYYAMEKIISQNDQDIVVYVAPTKALVNQVSAEVYARFKKDYSKGGQNLWGIWTREYQYMPLDCQVLITVPEMLELLLLSSEHLFWSRRIKRVIFDEIHCMGQLDGGRVWEHLLLLCSMPILCLSATIGSPENLLDWLKSIQSRHNIKVHLVQCHFRHSDLSKYNYNFPKSSSLINNSKQGRPKGTLTMIHPWGSLSINRVLSAGIPPSAKLSPLECLMVSNTLEALDIKDSGHVWVKNYFSDSSFIRREDVFNFERDLKTFLASLAAKSENDFENVVGHLSGRLKQSPSKEIKLVLKEPKIFENYSLPPFADFCLDLRDQEMLPAIVFSFSRNENERLAMELKDALYEMEKLIRENPEFQKEQSRALKEKEAQEKKKKKKSATEIAREKKKLESGEAEVESSSYDYEKAHPYCTLVPKYNTVTAAEVEDCINSFKYSIGDSRGYLIEAMRRGIGVHHAGMPRKYLSAVERLMRSGYLTVVLGTGTLALGINMPCKTSIFFKDSIELTPSEYQQMSGRAGRRGFDQEGFVVFVDIHKSKIDRLMCSELPVLGGHFPLTTTLVLRMFLLYTQAEQTLAGEDTLAKNKKLALSAREQKVKDLELAEQMIRNIILNSLFTNGNVIAGDQILHYFRCSVCYLLSEKYIDQCGFLVNFSALAVHLYNKEPENVAFIYLFHQGVFHKMCSDVKYGKPIPDSLILEIANILCHIFNRVEIPHRSVSHFQEVAKVSRSCIFLEPLSDNLYNLLEEHNSIALDIYQRYCNEMAKVSPVNHCHLPRSGIALPCGSNSSRFLEALKRSKCDVVTRSMVSALSGKGDKFDSFDDLVNNIREDIYLERSAIPYINTEASRNSRLNSYILDFLKQGSLKAVENENLIIEGFSWETLREFEVILQAICASLIEHLKIKEAVGTASSIDANVLMCFQELQRRFTDQFNNFRKAKQ